MKVILYSDGSARENPDGPGGFGTRIEYTAPDGEVHIREFSQGFKKTTNNRMELLGVITGLEALIKPCQVTIYTDSQYVCRAFNDNWIEGWIKKGWKRGKNEHVKNKNLWQRLLKAMEIHDCTYVWVKGHAGNPGNERCDELATAAADGDMLLDDTFGD